MEVKFKVETKKSRVFARKVVALFLAVLMSLTCFSGAISAFAAEEERRSYYDEQLAYNYMAWVEATDEQTAEALFDWADEHLSELATSLLGSDHLSFNINIIGKNIGIDGYLDSIDGLLNIIAQANKIVNDYKGLIGGNVGDISLGAINDLTPSTQQTSPYMVSKCKKSYRANYTAKQILMKVMKIVYENAYDSNGSNPPNNVVGAFLKGQMSLGLAESFIGGNVYSLLKDPLGMWDGYQSNLVYNIVSNLIITNVDWFTEAEKTSYLNDIKSSSRTHAWNFDKVFVKVLNEKLLQNISVLVNYPTYYTAGDGNRYNETSYTRMRDGKVQDPNLKYSDQYKDDNGVPMNVYLFQYGDEKLELKLSDNLFSFSFRALKLAWNTVLKDTLSTLHVINGDMYEHDFDNKFFYWAEENIGWDYKNWKSNYSQANVNAWAQAVYADYGDKSAEAFLKRVKTSLVQSRNVVADATNSWRDIDSSMLFAKMRYNPLADLYFNIPTGPINLYFEQTGTPSINAFFSQEYGKYTSIFDGFNNALVAIVDDFFPQSNNVGYTKKDGTFVAVNHPTLATTKSGANAATITDALVPNVLKMVEYTANATDANLLNKLYATMGVSEADIIKSQTLSEDNFESAMVPFLIAGLQNVSLIDQIHPEKWDVCADFESVGIVVLDEYLSNILPDKDYSALWRVTDGKIVVGTVKDQDGDGDADLVDTVLLMGRDVAAFWLQTVVPVRDKNGNAWDVTKKAVTDSLTIFDILNSILCNYASADQFADKTYGTSAATILGVCDGVGNCKVTMKNSVWTNIDVIANKFFPILGRIQYGTTSGFNSKDLLWNDVIAGLADISNKSMHKSGKAGISNLVQRFLTMASSSPISNNDGQVGFNVMAYNFIADAANSLFGARYNGQAHPYLIPYANYYGSNQATPFDALVDSSTLAYFSNGDGYNQGVLGILVSHLYEYFGCDSGYTTSAPAGVKGCWNGAMFVVRAVNNFIPSFVPQLAEHKLAGTTAIIGDATQSGITGKIRDTSLDITNNSVGLNRAYKTASGEVVQDGRYFVVLRGIIVETDNPKDNGYKYLKTPQFSNPIIAPGETRKFDITTIDPKLHPDEYGARYTYTVTYDIYQGKNIKTLDDLKKYTPIYKDVETKAYMFITAAKNWSDSVYTVDENNNYTFIPDNQNVVFGKSNDFVYTTTKGGQNRQLYATVPKDVVIPMTDIKSVENDTYHLTNAGSGSPKAYSMYSYLTKGTTYYDVNGTAKTATDDDKTLAYVAVDGDANVVNYNLYDYTDPSTGKLNRGNAATSSAPASGYTQAEIDAIFEKLPEDQQKKFKQSTHIAYTYEEAKNFGLIKGVIKDDDKINALLFTVNQNLCLGGANKASVSLATTVPGIIFATGESTVAQNAHIYQKMFKVINESSVKPGNYPMGVATYTNGTSTTAQIFNTTFKTNMIVADDSASVSVNMAYNEALRSASVYRPADLNDSSEDGSSSTIFDNLQEALSNTISTLTTPLTADLASKLTSVTETVANTEVTNNRRHEDPAYLPVKTTTALPASIAANAVKGANGYWYYDENCTAPIYSNTRLTAADVKSGKDPAGALVEAEGDTFYHINDNSYVVKWNTSIENAPFRYKDTKQQAQNDNGLLYEKLNFTYYDANGNVVYVADKDTADWAFKVANIKTQIKPTKSATQDYRSLYQKAQDNLDYNLEMLQTNLKDGLANIIGAGVVQDSKDMSGIDYDSVLYGMMRKMANEAGDLITTNYIYVLKDDHSVVVKLSPTSTTLKKIYVDDKGNQYDSNQVEQIVDPAEPYSTTHSSIEIDTAKALYDDYKARAEETRRSYLMNNALGSKLEAEIVCATGNAYTNYTVEQNDENVVIKTTAKSVKYGQLVDGVITNTDYSTESWNAYVKALANALEAIRDGRSGKREVNVSEIYANKANLMRAENKLTVGGEDPGETTFTVSGTVVVSKDATGTTYSGGKGGLTVTAGGVSVETEADGSFEIEVPIGTTELVVSGPSTIDRTVGISGTVSSVVIPVAICDYNKDKVVNETDIAMFYQGLKKEDKFTDYNCDFSYNETDIAMFYIFVGQTIVYPELNF